MADLGRAALVTSFLLLLYALLGGSLAAWKGRRRLAESAQNALLGSFAATVVATAVLLGALARHDFSFQYVADHTSRELPLGYTLTAFWGGQEGSLLLWLLVLSGYSVAAVLTARRARREVLAWVVPTLARVGTFFARSTDERWIIATRRWTLAAWAFLGIGQLLGAHWAYVEIGWGGFYAWDPVENAALMPWLAATAFLHSVMIQEKRGMLKVWNVLLIVLAFGLSLFGTFLTRSGIIQSIHSFTQSSIGPWCLGFICLFVVGSLTLVVLRLPLLPATTRLESLVSREATFLYNNLLLVALVLEFARGTSARRALGGVGWLGAFSSLVARNRRRYGGYVVHAAVVLLAIGVAGSSAYGATKIQRFRPGDTMKIRGYTLTYLNSVERHSANHDELRARVAVTETEKPVGTTPPGKTSSSAEQQPPTGAAINHAGRRPQDLFVIGDEFKFQKKAVSAVYLKVLVKPLVNLIWLAGFVFLLGSVITLWPDAREQRRLAARSEPGVALPVPGRS